MTSFPRLTGLPRPYHIIRIMEPLWFFARIVTMLLLLQRSDVGLGESGARGTALPAVLQGS